MADLDGVLAKLKGSWMTGQSALKHAPDNWQPILNDTTPEIAELRLVALAGQATQVAFRPAPPAKLPKRANLPSLELPPLPDAHRPAFRRIMEAQRANQTDQLAVIRFLCARGFIAHPTDWMPSLSQQDAIPNIYAPWLTWLADKAAADRSEVLTEDTWELFAPAEQRTELMRLREVDQTAARALLVAKAGSEPAERRLRLVSVLETNLSTDDVPYLETLATDRSGKVKELAAGFLARLGHGIQVGENERELADFLKRDIKGIVSRRSRVRPPKLKNNTQRARRLVLFEQVALAGLATALDITDRELVESWEFGVDLQVDSAFLAMLTRTASDDLAALAVEQWLAADISMSEGLRDLIARLPASQQWITIRDIAKRSLVSFEDLTDLTGTALGELSKDETLNAPALKELIATLTQLNDREHSSARTRLENLAGEQVFYLGLMANVEAAQAAIDALLRIGILAADPKLAMLRLNVALPNNPPSTPQEPSS